jgi:hypothetical protein
MKRLRHLAFLFLLPLALAMGQQAAVLHDLGHAAEKLSGKQDPKRSPTSSKCDECGLFAELSGAVGAKAPIAPFVAASTPREAAIRERDATLAPRHAFRSRAPPAAPA